MIDLSKHFGALICTVQLAAFTFAMAFLSVFTEEFLADAVFVLLLFGVVIGAMQFFDRILSFTDTQRAYWVSFTPVLASAVLWGYYQFLRRLSEIREYFATASSEGAGVALQSSFGSPPLWTFLFFQIAIIAASVMLLFPAVRADRRKVWLLGLPVVSALLGWVVGTWFMGGSGFLYPS